MIGDSFWVNLIVEGNYVPSDIGIYDFVLLVCLVLYYCIRGYYSYLMIKRFCNSNLRVFLYRYIITLFITH